MSHGVPHATSLPGPDRHRTLPDFHAQDSHGHHHSKVQHVLPLELSQYINMCIAILQYDMVQYNSIYLL